jgi:hypothetical protein
LDANRNPAAPENARGRRKFQLVEPFFAMIFSSRVRGRVAMSISDAIAPQLTYLRSNARALTGSQKTGDAHVEAGLSPTRVPRLPTRAHGRHPSSFSRWPGLLAVLLPWLGPDYF